MRVKKKNVMCKQSSTTITRKDIVDICLDCIFSYYY